jgi:uncharacterized protein (DUF2236 family)
VSSAPGPTTTGGGSPPSPTPFGSAARRAAQLTPEGLPIVRTAVRRVLGRMFGPPHFDPTRDPGDPGLAGPGSASWQVIAEPAAIAGGIRGLLLQVAHPLAMAGVHDHSAFREDPLGRLQRTTAYITTTTFGSTREALAVSRRVRRVHPHVRGTAPDGRPYSAEDPELLAWVSIALTSSFLITHQRWSPHPVTGDRADAFVAEQSRIAALLDPRMDLDALEDDEAALAALRDGTLDLPMLEDGRLPTTVAALHERLVAFAPELGVGEQGREALRFLRQPPIPLVARGGYRALFGGAVASLRPDEAAALEVEVSRIRRAALATRAGALLTTMRLTNGTSPSARLAAERAARTPSDAEFGGRR